MSSAALDDRIGAETSLLIVDLISDFEFEDGERLFERAKPMLERLSNLKTYLKSRTAPVIYVNDELSQNSGSLGEDLSRLRSRSDKADHVLSLLTPQGDDHWIVKPQRSGFFATGLANLLMSLNVSSVIVAGVTTDICVFFTAHDAHMRGHSVWVPEDCCAAVEDSYHEQALEFLSRVAEAETYPAGPLLGEKERSLSRGGSNGVYTPSDGGLLASPALFF